MVRIIGTKIRKLREEMELTQEDLARSVGLSSEFISLLELGRRSPSLESLSRIAKFLNKEISFFILERAESFDTLIKGEKLDLKTRRLLKKFRKYCDDYLGLEEMTGRQSDLAPLYGNVSAEKMAAQERSRLELGEDPVSNVFLLLEQNGLHVCRFPIQDEINIAGAFVFLEYKQAAFALVNSRQPFLQQALTAVHEYGHYLKDRFDGPIIDNPDIFIEDYITLYHGREKYVQTFALHFLLPPGKLSDFIQKDLRCKQLTMEDVLYIRRYYDVSFLAILQMLKKLEFISLGQFKEWQKRDWEQHENSLFGSRRLNVPQRGTDHSLLSPRYISLVLDAFRIKKISAEKAAQLMRVNKEKFLSLCRR